MVEQSNDAVMEASLLHKLESLSEPHQFRSIYKVPEHVRKGSKKSYQPSVISIGPNFYRNQLLKPSQDLKLRHLQGFLKHDSHNSEWNLGRYIISMRQWEKEARSYYAEDPLLTSDEFTEMLLLDSAFIVYLFMECHPSSNNFQIKNNLMKNKLEVLFHVQRDLFLQENQIPFFVLERLYTTGFGTAYPNIDFHHLTREFICQSFMLEVSQSRPAELKGTNLQATKIMHILDFYRKLCLPANPGKPSKAIDFPLSAKHLKAAGVRFVASNGSNLLDIKFSLDNGKLEIPKLKILATTEDIFRNIICFEQCHYTHQDSFFMSYVFFLDELIDTAEDVQILEKCGIIDHWLGSDHEVATVFNTIAKNVSTHNFNFYYADLCRDLNKFALRKRNKWMATLRRDYFNHPWSVISVCYLGVLLVLTVLQVVPGFLDA